MNIGYPFIYVNFTGPFIQMEALRYPVSN